MICFRLGRLLATYRMDIKGRNIKENWSILQYIGESTDGIGGFTHGRYYYCPCSLEKPADWKIIEDPTGMIARYLDGRQR